MGAQKAKRGWTGCQHRHYSRNSEERSGIAEQAKHAFPKLLAALYPLHCIHSPNSPRWLQSKLGRVQLKGTQSRQLEPIMSWKNSCTLCRGDGRVEGREG